MRHRSRSRLAHPRATTADPVRAEEAILSRDHGEVEDPIHGVSYSFHTRAPTSGSTAGSRMGSSARALPPLLRRALGDAGRLGKGEARRDLARPRARRQADPRRAQRSPRAQERERSTRQDADKGDADLDRRVRAAVPRRDRDDLAPARGPTPRASVARAVRSEVVTTGQGQARTVAAATRRAISRCSRASKPTQAMPTGRQDRRRWTHACDPNCGCTRIS
jgi:hypothetical protein